MDILLDAPQLKAKALNLEIENLELANLLRIGKVGLAIEHLDAELFLQTQLGDLLRAVNQLISTVNLSASLLFTPVHNLNVAVAAWYGSLELTRRWFELPIKFSEGRKRLGPAAVARPRRLRERARNQSELAHAREHRRPLRPQR